MYLQQTKHQEGTNDGQNKPYHLFSEIATAVYHRTRPIVGDVAVGNRVGDAVRDRRKNRSS